MIRGHLVLQKLNTGNAPSDTILKEIPRLSLNGFIRIDTASIRSIENQCVSSDSGIPINDNDGIDASGGDQVPSRLSSKSALDYIRGFSMAAKCSLMVPPNDLGRKKDIPRNSMTSEEIKARWHNLDPVDMETVEREHFLKTGQVLRTRHVQARATLAPPGARLRQVLAMHVLDTLETLSVNDLGTFLSLIASIPDPHALFHRDLKIDAQFKICKKLCSLRDEEMASILIPTTAALISFDPQSEIPSRVWRRKIIPVVRRSLKEEGIRQLIDSTQPSLIPLPYRDWDPQSLRVLVVSHILSSGRIRASNRLISNLRSFIRDPLVIQDKAREVLKTASEVSGINIISTS